MYFFSNNLNYNLNQIFYKLYSSNIQRIQYFITISNNNVNDYFEIGTWRGESVANIADVVANCITFNLPDEELKQLGFSEDYINMHRFFSKDIKNVQHLFGNSHKYNFDAHKIEK